MRTRSRLVALAVVALGAAAGYLGYRWQSRLGGPAALTAAAPGEAANGSLAGSGPAPGAVAAAPAIPDTLPDVRLSDLDGRSRSLKEFGRRPLIVNFWATWCEPCRREMPLLLALREEHAAERLEILGVAIDFRDSVTEFLKKTPLAYPQLVGEEDGMEAARAFGVPAALPFSVFVDEQDRIVAVKVGELHREEASAILEAMRQLRAGKVSLADTRTRISERLKTLATQRARQAA